MHKAVNSTGYGKALFQKLQNSFIIHTYKQVDETAVIIEAYISYQLLRKFYLKLFSNFLIPFSEVIIKIIRAFRHCILPQLLIRK
jgi:hypothetical protein